MRSSCVLEHLARGVAVLATCQGAGLASGAPAVVDLSELRSAANGALLNTGFLSITAITPAPETPEHQQQPQEVALGKEEPDDDHSWTWPPPVERVDLAVCGPWSQHLMVVWGLHHLHALDGGGHCGLHPELVRGLPQVWEARDQKQNGGVSSASGAGGSGSSGSGSSSSSGPLRVLQSNALWRLTELLQLYAAGAAAVTKRDRANLMELSKALSGNAVVAASMAAARQQVRDAGMEAELSDQLHQLTTGVANSNANTNANITAQLLSRLVPATRPGGSGSGGGRGWADCGGEQRGPGGSSSAAWTVSGGDVRMLAARVVRAAVVSAGAWQREEQQQHRGGGAGVSSTSGALAGGGDTEGIAGEGAGPSAPPLVLKKHDAMGLALRALEAYGTSVRTWEAARGAARQQAAREGAAGQGAAAAPAQGRSQAQGGGREARAVRLWCELYRLGFEVVRHVVPCCGGAGLGGLEGQLLLGLPRLPCDGERRPVLPCATRAWSRGRRVWFCHGLTTHAIPLSALLCTVRIPHTASTPVHDFRPRGWPPYIGPHCLASRPLRKPVSCGCCLTCRMVNALAAGCRRVAVSRRYQTV